MKESLVHPEMLTGQFAVLQSIVGVIDSGDMTVTPQHIGTVFVAGIHFVAAAVVTGDDETAASAVPGVGNGTFSAGLTILAKFMVI